MNYCCARGNCGGCWHHWVRYHRLRWPGMKPKPITNQDTGDEDDSRRQKGYVE